MNKEFSKWCDENVVTVVKYCMAGMAATGGTFERQIAVPMKIKNAEGSFTLPIPDQISRDDGTGPKSKEALDGWVTIITETIHEFWDKSFEGMRYKILSELASFGLLHPNSAKELRGCFKCEDNTFFFDVGDDSVKRIALVKFDEWAKNRNASNRSQN